MQKLTVPWNLGALLELAFFLSIKFCTDLVEVTWSRSYLEAFFL